MNRIKEILKSKSMTLAELAETLGVSRQALSKQINGNMLVDTAQKIADALHVPLWQIFASPKDVGPNLVNEIEDLTDEEGQTIGEAIASGNCRMVPLVHIDSVGGIHSDNSMLSPEYIEGYIPLTGARSGDIAIYQSGNSMAPAIPSGAILHIREVEDWKEYIGYGDVFVLLLRDERRITKEIRRYDPDPANYYLCVSYNPDVSPEELPKRMVRGVWKVIRVLIDRGW